MRNKLYKFKFTPPWENGAGFGRKHKTCSRNRTKIIANPGLVMKVLRRKKILLFLAYFLLVAVTMLNLVNYTWTKEPKQCNQQVTTAFHSRLDTRFLFMAPQTRRRQLVYVLTTWRSGSSFFGELFNQNPGVFFLYEPMWHVWQKLYPADAVSLQGAERDMLSALYRCDFSVFQLYRTGAGRNLTTQDIFAAHLNKVICSYPLCSSYRKDVVTMVDDQVCKLCPSQDLSVLENECRKYDTIVIKGVRILDVNVLAPLMEDPSLNLKIIHLVRDPRAVANSRIKSKHGLIRENLQVVRSREARGRRNGALEINQRLKKDGSDFHAVAAMEVICEYMSRTLKTALNPPAWFRGKYMLVRYEDLVEDPIESLRTIYHFTNLTSSPDIESFVKNMTSGSSSSARPFKVSSRNATHAANAWRSLLSYQQIRQVEDYCRNSMSILGYLPIRSQFELKDLSRSLLMKPKV